MSLAIGASRESFGSPDLTGEGVVHILYGSASGLSSSLSQLFSENLIGLDPSEPGEQFGAALIAGNFGRDQQSNCYDDLAISATGEVVAGQDSAGSVHVIFGSGAGLSAAGSQLWTQDSSGIPGTPEFNDNFGRSFAAATIHYTESVCGEWLDDLAIGAPGYRVNEFKGAGSVWILYATNSGLTATGSQLLNENTPGVATEPKQGEAFGASLAMGLAGGPFLVVGVPGENLAKPAVGGVHILSTDGNTLTITGTESRFFQQNSTGIHDSPETNDGFGNAVAAGNYDGVGRDDLAIAVFGEDLAAENAGALHVLTDTRLTLEKFFHQNSVDMKDTQEPNDSFGFALSP